MKVTIPDDKIVFSNSFQVTAEDTDFLNHVNNVVYLKWIQEISEKHWNTFATSEMKEQLIWMVLQHKIDYLHQSFEGDTITISTWVEKNEGVKSTRKVLIYRDDVLLVSSETIWCLLDKKTMKPKRITDNISELFLN
ncbi:acyl-CoA thioesterase [Ulvibacter litoralis]|uniref:Acyl-CoA thioester hydrolase n=1 Tax=Ulvibacter litoralis TaxID=227084 RepID=A0A1G7CNF4_9FLAO|nr:thioesterase family protein [Ulvibacter litoralis]GHC46841.1 thioesterase [Ulvibacter litoralis]SDE40310.1 acyl-CoA thioester hydrolase [Ulvibacter litoralis]